jgi:uncharacterized peroxidase-related enzyme
MGPIEVFPKLLIKPFDLRGRTVFMYDTQICRLYLFEAMRQRGLFVIRSLHGRWICLLLRVTEILSFAQYLVLDLSVEKRLPLSQSVSSRYARVALKLEERPMPHISLPKGLQGIRGAMAFRPETAKPLNELAEALLHAPNSLPQADRELIATYVSYLNDCYFCQTVHGAIAAACLNDDYDLVKRVKADFQAAEISDKLKALLVIAAKVQKDGKSVTSAEVDAARVHGATDTEIHDTVLIAAAFCMYNRYVDGLDTWQPREEALYLERGKKTAREGYVEMSKEYLPRR